MRLLLLAALISLIPASAGCSQPAQNRRLTIEEARNRIREHVFQVKPGYNPDATIEVTDVTTDEVWNRLGFQLLKFKHWGVTYLVNGGELINLGGIWPNYMLVTDLNRDHEPELVYMRTSGSGRIWSYIDVAERRGGRIVIHRAVFACCHGNFCAPLRISEDEIGIFDMEWGKGDDRWTPSNRIATLRYDSERAKYWVTLREDLNPRSKELIYDIGANGGKTETYNLRR